jgi:hypothetical protein
VVTEPTIRSQCHPSGRRLNSDYSVHAAGGGRASSPRARARRASRDSIPCAVLPLLPCVGRRSGGAYLLANKSGATAARLIEKHRRTRPTTLRSRHGMVSNTAPGFRCAPPRFL